MDSYSVLSRLLDVLALERLTHMVWKEKIFQPVRELAGIVHDDDGEPLAYNSKSYLSYLFWCFWCLSVWVSGIYVLVSVINPPAYRYLRNVMAGSGIILVANKWLEQIR